MLAPVLATILSLTAATDEWSNRDALMLTTAGALITVDVLQSAALNDGWHGERNPLLGSQRPSPAMFYAAGVAGFGATWLIAERLNKPWRQMFLVGVIVAEFCVVGNNWSIGGRF